MRDLSGRGIPFVWVACAKPAPPDGAIRREKRKLSKGMAKTNLKGGRGSDWKRVFHEPISL